MTGRDAAGGHPAVGSDHGEGVGEEGEPSRVVEVGVADQGVLDLDLLRHRERATDGARVDQNPVVDQERRRPLPRPFTADTPREP